jgi:hypothetical protein
MMNIRRTREIREDGDEFFIGYAPPMPSRLARFVTRVVIGLACGLMAWAVTVAVGHVPLEGGNFEFGRPQQFAGTVVERPYPALRPHDVDPNTPWLLLVAPGKHGAGALVSGLDGRHVTLTGTRILRGAHTMIEVDPASLVVGGGSESRPTSSAAIVAESFRDGAVKVRGEVVDSKCFLGVMVPGAGKTHKECASLCLRGGIPPALYVQDQSGQSSLLLLTGASGEPIGAQALQVVGEAIDMTGTLHRQGGWSVLRTDPATWRPVAR